MNAPDVWKRFQAMPQRAIQDARAMLPFTCRAHDSPRPVPVGDEYALVCPNCNRFVSLRSVLGIPPAETKMEALRRRLEDWEAGNWDKPVKIRVEENEALLANAARISKSNWQACRMVGMSAPSSFARACRRFGIVTPNERRARERKQHGKIQS